MVPTPFDSLISALLETKKEFISQPFDEQEKIF
jgi:hypothetical protein